LTTTIALAGKGGTGKTTVAALLIKILTEQNASTILAIDADPSTNLNLVLGMPLENTVGGIREDMLDKIDVRGNVATGPGMTKHDYLDYQIAMALEESEWVDLLAMGRPEGQGCYCPVNHILRQIIDQMGRSYDYVVMDNEAGMEHLSRRTTRDVDVLLVVTDPTVRGVVAAGRIAELRDELSIDIRAMYLVINRLTGDVPAPLQQAVDELGIELAGIIPYDPNLVAFDAVGRPLVELSRDSDVYQAVSRIAQKIGVVKSTQKLGVENDGGTERH